MFAFVQVCMFSHLYSVENNSLTFHYDNAVVMSLCVCVFKGQCKVKVNVSFTHKRTTEFMFSTTGLQSCTFFFKCKK